MNRAPLVRLVDDDADLLMAQAQGLRLQGFQTQTFASAEAALQGMDADFPGVVLTDVRMPGMDGLMLFRHLHGIDPDLPVILLTGHGDVAMAVAALKAGAYDFLTKPVGIDDLAAALRRAASARALVLENRLLREVGALPPQSVDEDLPGDSPVMAHLRRTVERVAQAGVDALIVGPDGAGKHAVARSIHRQSAHRARGFIHVTCAALDPAQFEAEFLGQQTGGTARQARTPGLFERAHRGTLFLDEINMLPPALQARLLAVLQAREFTPTGASAPRDLDLRILAATRVDLAQLVADGRFRPDLYYRLSGVTVQVPPLSARAGDVPKLFRRFLLDACRRLDLPVPMMTGEVQARLQGHDWPGNLRELQQFAEYTALGLSPFQPAADGGGAMGLADLVADYESGLIRTALREAGGSVARALDRLRLPRKTLYDKMARHGIDPADFRK